MSSGQDVTDLKMEHIRSLIDQIKSAIPSLEELATATDEVKNSIQQQLASYALSLKTTKLKPEELEAFFRKPYIIIPVLGKQDNWDLILPRFIDMQVGWLKTQTESFNIFLINRYVEWLGGIPEEIKKQLGFKPALNLELQGDTLVGPRQDLEKAWTRFRPFLKDHNGKRILINQRRAFELLAALVKDGVLPFAMQPVPKEDLLPTPVARDFELRPYQKEAWETFLKYSHIGIFYPASVGKTFSAMDAMCKLRGPHLVPVPTRLLVEQWVDRIEAHTQLKAEDYVVCTYQMAIKKYANGHPDGRPWGLMAVDEVHHMPSNLFSKMALIKRRETLGLTASPSREDQREEYIFAFTGRPVGLGWQYFRELGIIKSPVCHVWILKNFEAKLARLKALLGEEKKTLLFADSIEIGKTIAARFNLPHVYGETKQRLSTIQEAPVSVVSRVADEGVSLPDIERVIEVSWLFGCYDKDTEILTRTGWKLFKDINYQDGIATLNKRGEIEYHKPEAIQDYPYIGPMFRFRGRCYDLLVTPEHNLFVKRKWRSAFEFICVQDLVGRYLKNMELKRDAKWNCEDREFFELSTIEPTDYIEKRLSLYEQALSMKDASCMQRKHRLRYYRNHKSIADIAKQLNVSYWTVLHWLNGKANPLNKQLGVTNLVERIPMEAFLKLLAWYISEGSIDHGRGVKITQLDAPHRSEITQIAKEAGFVPKYAKDSIRIHSKQLAMYLRQLGKSYQKFIPRWVLDLPPERLRICLQTLLKGDGNGKNVFYTSSKRLADDMQELTLKCGYAATISIHKEHASFGRIRGRIVVSRRPQYMISISYIHLTPQIYATPEKVEYDGRIYDVTVPNHVIMVRRNGRAVWCGNSRRQELQRFTRLLHGQSQEAEHHILMTVDEYLHDRKRLFSVMDKGFKLEIHREGVSEEAIARKIEGPSPAIFRSTREARKEATQPVAAAPMQEGAIAGILNLPGVKKIMASLPKAQQRVYELLLRNDGQWFKKSGLPLVLGYTSDHSMEVAVNFPDMVRRGLIEQSKIEKELAYRTNIRARM